MDYPVLNTYLKANPSSTIEQLFVIEDAIRYAKRLKGTTLDDIYNAKTERALYVIASALEIVAYTSKSKKQLRKLCIEKYNRVFKSTDEIKIKKNKKCISHKLRRLVWNTYINQHIGEHVCLCCEVTMMSQLNFECGHVISVHNSGKLELENLLRICTPCNRSMNSEDMTVFMEEQNMPGLRIFKALKTCDEVYNAEFNKWSEFCMKL